MIAVTPGLTLIILIAGIVAGAFGATLGLGGGIFLVPFLNLVLGLPITVAAAISLFGFESGAALATVVGVLIEVPVMLSVVWIVNRSQGWYETGAKKPASERLSTPRP